MINMDQLPDSDAAKVAFVMLSEAYMDLAQTLLRIEEEPARELLRGIEQRAALKLDSVETDGADPIADIETVALAAVPFRAVLREALVAAG